MSLSTSAESSEAPRASGHGTFALRRLHSLSGVLPLGVFVLVHVLSMASALWGREAFDSALSTASHARLAVEAVLIGVPLAFHAAFGLAIALKARPNVGRYPTPGAWAYALQRVTGPIVLLFVLLHLWQTRVRVVLGHVRSSDFFGDLASTLSSEGMGGVPWMAIAYLVGVGATAYHLSNGVVGFASSFGLVRSTRALRKLEILCQLGGVLVFAAGACTVLYLATGSPSLSGPS